MTKNEVVQGDDKPEGDVSGSEEHTKTELVEAARDLEIEGRSSMNKEELSEAVTEAVARRALAGDYGYGVERRRNLAAAGYDPNEVQRAVIRLLNP